MQLDFNELRELLATLNQTDITELTLKSGEFELKVRKGGGSDGTGVSVVTSTPGVGAGIGQLAVPPPAVSLATAPAADAAIVEPQSTAVAPGNASGSAGGISPPAIETKYETIASPMVGTFYRAISPGEPPFVEVGDRISSSQTVCIIEAFKVMNEVEAEISGEVVEILVENGESVEFDQPLMRVKPSGS